jgi:hypothetical protein
VKLGAAIIASLFLTACASHDEVARIPNPDGQTEAVLVESDGNAITPFWYNVYIVEKGRRYSSAPPAAYIRGATLMEDSANHLNSYGVNLRWDGPSKLIVEFLNSEEEKTIPIPPINGKQISVVFHGGVEDKNAPIGGMEYNLHKHK